MMDYNTSSNLSTWTLVSTQLPKQNGEYLVTLMNKSTNQCSLDIAYFEIDNSENNGFYKANDVIAWMPLPEPYCNFIN